MKCGLGVSFVKMHDDAPLHAHCFDRSVIVWVGGDGLVVLLLACVVYVFVDGGEACSGRLYDALCG